MSDNTALVVTDTDRKLARGAIVEGWHNCRHTNNIGFIGKPCDCNHGTIDGCKAKVEGVAKAIAVTRSWAEDEQRKRHKAEEDRTALRGEIEFLKSELGVEHP